MMPAEKTLEDRILAAGRVLLTLVLGIAAAFYVVKTIHWQWMHDESIMRYVNFLIDHGKAPYREIIDPNMPGSFFIDGWAMRIFGAGDLGTRFYEFFLLSVLTAAMIVIAWPVDWFAGLFAGILFTILHGIDGPLNALERDEIMTVLVLAAFAFLFSALRRRRPILMLPFGLLIGLAGALKPTAAPLGVVLLVMVWLTLRDRSLPAAPYLGMGILGGGAATLIVGGFFLKHHAGAAFLDVSGRLLPDYARMGNLPLLALLVTLSMKVFVALLPPALLLAIARPGWRDFERLALLLGLGFGAASYLVQRKGFVHHRYPLLAFFLLWAAIEFTGSLRSPGWRRAVGAAGLAVGVFLILPLYVRRLAAVHVDYNLPIALQADLTRLGGSSLPGGTASLQNEVQCFDMVSGCLTALYRMGLVQNTLFIGDYMFLPPAGSTISPFYRDLLWKDFERHPPRVIVLTNQWLMEANSFDKLETWPQMAGYVARNYTLDATRTFGPGEFNNAYRLYVRKPDAPLGDTVP